MIFAAICMLNGSPGPSPGAPLKSPIVSFTTPFEPTDPAPDAKFMRLNKLNISARSCNFTRSFMGMFLITDRSTSANPGPVKAFRPRLRLLALICEESRSHSFTLPARPQTGLGRLRAQAKSGRRPKRSPTRNQSFSPRNSLIYKYLNCNHLFLKDLELTTPLSL